MGAETYGTLGALFKAIGTSVGNISELNRLAKETEQKRKRQTLMDELAQGRFDLAEDRFGFEQSQAENRLKTDMMGRLNQQQEQPKPMTEMEGLKIQEQKLKVAKMLRELEQGGQSDKSDELDKNKKAYQKFTVQWKPDDYGFETVPSFGEFMTIKKGTGMPGAGVKGFKGGLPSGKTSSEDSIVKQLKGAGYNENIQPNWDAIKSKYPELNISYMKNGLSEDKEFKQSDWDAFKRKYPGAYKE